MELGYNLKNDDKIDLEITVHLLYGGRILLNKRC
jgi:hypothetical protein